MTCVFWSSFEQAAVITCSPLMSELARRSPVADPIYSGLTAER
ncbi:hypothetical protein SynBIOSE41_00972 [Synechococcus sp. BIOS-E4-1]|nr:hypothetical protein SynBIOSE41_00972 [Synechococcus sp. BIOS-E4-1]